MTALEEVADVDFVSDFIRRGFTHRCISVLYCSQYLRLSRTSERSVRRYCYDHGIRKISNDELDDMVNHFIQQYGHGYGLVMMQGSIRCNLGVTTGVISQRNVAISLRRIAPNEYDSRSCDMMERTNPILYYAPYFRYKVIYVK